MNDNPNVMLQITNDPSKLIFLSIKWSKCLNLIVVFLLNKNENNGLGFASL